MRALGGLSEAGFAGFFGIFRMGEDLLTQVGSDERWTRVCERLREITRRVWVDCLEQDCGIYWDFQDGGDLLTQVRSLDERCERERFASVYVCWADCLEQDLQDFLGFSGWRGPRRHWCARTRDCERSRAFACVYVCWAGCLEQDLQDFLGFSGWREALLTQVRSYERWRSRAFASVYVCWADCLEQDLQDLLGFSMAGTCRHWCARTRDCERLS